MSIIDIVARLFGYVTKEFVIVPIAVTGYLWGIQRDLFGKALVTLLFAMIYNHFLKGVFQVPLNPALGIDGWAFPSGHFHMALAFWGSLAWYARCRIGLAISSLLLIGVGFHLMHFGYHNIYDILGAFGFGAVNIFIFDWVFRNPLKDRSYLITAPMFVLMVVMSVFYPKPMTSDFWLALGALSGFGLGWGLFDHYRVKLPSKNFHKIMGIILAFAGIAGIYTAVMFMPRFLGKPAMQFSLIAFWASFASPWLFQKVVRFK